MAISPTGVRFVSCTSAGITIQVGRTRPYFLGCPPGFNGVLYDVFMSTRRAAKGAIT
jgi:hypothetical protein